MDLKSSYTSYTPESDGQNEQESSLEDPFANFSNVILKFLSSQGVGGSVQYPRGFLKEAYEMVRARGGVCIADEVQTGFGRLGSHYWGFETHDVMPDMGKSIQNL